MTLFSGIHVIAKEGNNYLLFEKQWYSDKVCIGSFPIDFDDYDYDSERKILTIKFGESSKTIRIKGMTLMLYGFLEEIRKKK